MALPGAKMDAVPFSAYDRSFLLAASLGGVEALIVLRIYTSHYRRSTVELAASWVGPGTVRMSIGLEDPDDLIADMKLALS